MHRPHSGPVESKSPGLGLGHLCFYKVPREFSQASRVESQSDDGAGSHPLHGTLAVALQGHQSPCVGCLLLYYALSSQIGNTEQKIVKQTVWPPHSHHLSSQALLTALGLGQPPDHLSPESHAQLPAAGDVGTACDLLWDGEMVVSLPQTTSQFGRMWFQKMPSAML